MKEEYEKFFKDPIKIPPDHVIAYENILERQLSYEERVRHEYAKMRNNFDLYVIKH
jgi:hypothetical protein